MNSPLCNNLTSFLNIIIKSEQYKNAHRHYVRLSYYGTLSDAVLEFQAECSVVRVAQELHAMKEWEDISQFMFLV